MQAYKVAKNNDKRVIVTLEIPADARTNMGRSSVVVKETAKYRANKVKVMKIEDEEGNTYDTATTGFYRTKLIYKVGEVIEEPDYDMNIENVCSSGIHFFLSRHVAELYDLAGIQNGVFQSWHENGRKQSEVNYSNGKKNGLCQEWFDDGKHFTKTNYCNGIMNGLYQEWFYNGQIHVEGNYSDGVLNGIFHHWYLGGEKCYEINHINGEINVLYKG